MSPVWLAILVIFVGVAICTTSFWLGWQCCKLEMEKRIYERLGGKPGEFEAFKLLKDL